MIRSQVPNLKATNSHSMVSLQTDSRNHVESLYRQFGTSLKSDAKTTKFDPPLSSNKMNPESLNSKASRRKTQRKLKGGAFPNICPREQFVAKRNTASIAHNNRETFEVSQAFLRKITEVDLEQSRKEEDFILMIHDLRMLSEMTMEGTYEKVALLEEIEVLHAEYEKAIRVYQDISDSLQTQQQRDQPDPLTNDKYLLSRFRTTSDVTVQTDQLHNIFLQTLQSNKLSSSKNSNDNDLVCKDQILMDIDCKSIPCKGQVESKEIEELQNVVVLLIAQRDALKADFEGFCDMVSNLVSNTDDLIVVDQNIEAMEVSKDALFLKQKNFLHDINKERNEQQKIRDSIIECQTQEIYMLHSELTNMKNESDSSKERAETLCREMSNLSIRYDENLNSIKLLQEKFFKEEVRSTSLLFAKDFECENSREEYATELIKMKNEISVISFENVLLSSQIIETSADLRCSEKMVNGLNVKMNELLSLIDQLRTQNYTLVAEVGNLSDISTSYQQSAFCEKLELLNELNKARSTILLLQKENTSLLLKDSVLFDKKDQSDMQQEIAKLHDMVEKIETEKEMFRRLYLSLFEQVAVLDSQNTYKIGLLMENTRVLMNRK